MEFNLSNMMMGEDRIGREAFRAATPGVLNDSFSSDFKYQS